MKKLHFSRRRLLKTAGTAASVAILGQPLFRVGTASAMPGGQMRGFCWPLSAAPGEAIEFRIGTTSPKYRLTFVRFENRDPAEVTADVIRNSQELKEIPVSDTIEVPGQTQPAPNPEDLGCGKWELSYRFEIPKDWASDIYAAKCVEVEAGETFYIVFVVKPAPSARHRLLLLANVSTWNAYNTYGGRSRYTTTGGGDSKLSYLRPNPHTINLSIPDTSDSPLIQLRYTVGWETRHLARAEMWVLSWLQQAGYACDVFTDLDWHFGIDRVEQYAAVILSTHPEYWSIPMLKNLKAYLNKGGSLLYLGGNGIFDKIDVSDDGTVMTVHGTVDRRTMAFRSIGMPESAVLGIAFVRNVDDRKGYEVRDASHPFMRGLTNGELIGGEGWNIYSDSSQDVTRGISLSEGAASGWETDRTDKNSPPVTILAEGRNDPGRRLDGTYGSAGAQMIYYDHPGGGFVFSVGSITFGGSLVVDAKLQRIVRSAFDDVLKRSPSSEHNPALRSGLKVWASNLGVLGQRI